jgi:hypothetical protein
VRFKGSHVRVRVDRSVLTVHADPLAPVTVGGTAYTAGPAGLQLVRHGAHWGSVR